MDISPYLSAIQSLNGQHSSEKYQELHASAKRLAEVSKEKGVAVAVSSSPIQPALHPLLRILIGIALKSRDEVINSLKSEDVTVQNQALRATWFFDGSDNLNNADFFVNELMPFVTVQAQKKIIKALSINLRGKPESADNFFGTFVNAYGFERASPILTACKEDTIYEMIVKHSITLTKRQMRHLFHAQPKLMVRYLREGLAPSVSRTIGKEIPFLHENDSDLNIIFPYLVKNYPDDYLKYCKEIRYDIKLGKDLKNYLLKNHVDKLIANPKVFMALFSLEIISEKLTPQQFEEFFGNFYATTTYDISRVLGYLKYYPKDKHLMLIKRNYKLKFNKELLDDLEYIKSYELLALLPLEERQNVGRRLVNSTPRVSHNYYRWCCYLPPAEAFAIFKSEIAHSTDANNRLHFFKKMMDCSLANESKEYMLHFLNFYNDRHKNEGSYILQEVVAYIGTEIPCDFLNKSHWTVLRKIMFRSYIKKELFAFSIDKFFTTAFYHLLAQCKNELSEGDTKKFLDEFIDIILEYCVDRGFRTIIYVFETPEITKQCFDIFLQALPLKYSDEHEIWKNANKKINYVNNVLETIDYINKKYYKINKKNDLHKMSLLDFPWLVKAIKSILVSNKEECSQNIENMKNLLEKMEPDFYNSMVPRDESMETNETTIEEIDISTALKLLHKNPEKIYNNWMEYLTACQKQTNDLTTRRFLRASKWHQTLPLHFITHCLNDLNNPANLTILGLLLEGELLSKELSQLISEVSKFQGDNMFDRKTYEIIESIPAAIDVTNPPVTCQLLETFCRGDLVRFAVRSIVRISQRMNIPRVKQFAEKLIDKPVSMQRYGFYMYLRLASENEQQKFLLKALKTMKHPTMHELVVKKIRGMFVKCPSEATWELMKECIAGITAKNNRLLNELCSSSHRWNCTHNFAGRFYIELFLKIEKLAESGDIDEASKKSYLTEILRTMYSINNVEGLPDKECQDILQRYLFNKEFNCRVENSFDRHVLSFALRNYIFETLDKLESRWNFVSQFLSITVKKWDLKDPSNSNKYPANFTIRIFFNELFKNISSQLHYNNESKKSFGPIKCILNTFSTILSPSQEISFYLKLYFMDLYSESMSWKDYGIKCGQDIPNLVKEFSSELILEYANDCIYFVSKCSSFDERLQTIRDIMEGLCEVNNSYAAFTCIKLLNQVEFSDLDKFTNIIDYLRKNNNIGIKCKINDFVSSLVYK